MSLIMIVSNMYLMYFDHILPSYHFVPSMTLFPFPTSTLCVVSCNPINAIS